MGKSGASRRTHRKGFGSGRSDSKLTEEIVIKARYLKMNGDLNIFQMAKNLKVNYSTLWHAVNGMSWKHVPDDRDSINQLYNSLVVGDKKNGEENGLED